MHGPSGPRVAFATTTWVQRIACARAAVPECRRDEPRAADLPSAAAAAARLALEVAERRPHGRLMTADGLARDVGLGDAEEEADALRRPGRQVESRDGTRRERPPQRLARRRILGCQQPAEAVLVDLSGQPERPGRRSRPLPRRLTLTCVDRAGVRRRDAA